MIKNFIRTIKIDQIFYFFILLLKGIGKAKNRLLVVEGKYRNKALSLAVLEHVMESVSIFPAEYYDVYLFSKSGFADDIRALNNPTVHLISVEDMVR